MGKTVTIDNFAAAVGEILQQYGDDLQQNMNQIVKNVSKKGAAAVRTSARGAVGGTGKYAKGWTSETDVGRLRVEGTIYNKTPGLPHLLEHGHALRNGGRTGARTHIAPVEEKVIREFESMVKSKL